MATALRRTLVARRQRSGRRALASLGTLVMLMLASGCGVLPRPANIPTIQNPFPQLSKVAVAPFFNHSAEPAVDGRQFALAYYGELQSTPGFEVVSVGAVERAMSLYGITLKSAEDARRLAQVLEVDAVVVGAVVDYSPYYPPRVSMHIEWYAANPYFHEIPAGYGLPFGTPEEEQIPASLVFEAEMALAKAQLKMRTPPYDKPVIERPMSPTGDPASDPQLGQEVSHLADAKNGADRKNDAEIRNASELNRPQIKSDEPGKLARKVGGGISSVDGCKPFDGPVLRHTQLFLGNDARFAMALENYYASRDEARYGGWQSYLQRSDDFIRFCCHMHISQMLTARGGAGETRVVWRWPNRR